MREYKTGFFGNEWIRQANKFYTAPSKKPIYYALHSGLFDPLFFKSGIFGHFGQFSVLLNWSIRTQMERILSWQREEIH